MVRKIVVFYELKFVVIKYLPDNRKNTMINYKKKINKIKTKSFLTEFPIIFLLQHHNFTIKDWFDLRLKLKEINNVEILNVKNSLLKKNLLTFNNNENLEFLCQGPNLIIGCKNENDFKQIWNFINYQSKLQFISCFYKKKLWNHLDIEIYLKTTLSIYSEFIKILEKKTNLCETLEYNLKINPLFIIKSNQIQILEHLKHHLKISF